MHALLDHPSRWLAYVASVALSGLAVLLRLALDPVWGNSKAYLMVFPAVMVATWFGGRGPGFVATLLCVLGVDYFWAKPTMSFSHKSAADVLGLLAFIALGLFVSHLHATVREQRERARIETARAEQERRAREELMTIVAHDLRNPLHTILMTSTLLRTKSSDPALFATTLGLIERSVSRMDHLIQDLLVRAKIEAGELRLASAPAHPTELLSEAVDTALPLAQARGIEVRQEGGRAAWVTCDRERVLQVLANLLGNALKFTPEGGSIVVGAAAVDPTFVRFDVADTGRGIAREHLPHIFERHWRDDPRGTGFGLHIAAGIVHAHGGKIWAESEPGKGTTIRFTLLRSDTTTVPTPATLTLGSQQA
jgi:signal transduction histidine kinase